MTLITTRPTCPILPQALELLNSPIYDHAFIAGGYARLLTGSQAPCSDIDLFCRDDVSIIKLDKLLNDLGYLTGASSFAATSYTRTDHDLPVQVVHPLDIDDAPATYGDIPHVLSLFDFTVSCAAIVSAAELLVDSRLDEDDNKMILRIINITHPISCLYRVCKYFSKGYHLNWQSALKIFRAWDELTEEHKSSLGDMLDSDVPSAQDINAIECLIIGVPLQPVDAFTACRPHRRWTFPDKQRTTQ